MIRNMLWVSVIGFGFVDSINFLAIPAFAVTRCFNIFNNVFGLNDEKRYFELLFKKMNFLDRMVLKLKGSSFPQVQKLRSALTLSRDKERILAAFDRFMEHCLVWIKLEMILVRQAAMLHSLSHYLCLLQLYLEAFW